MKKRYEIKKMYYKNSDHYFLVIHMIPEMLNIDYFLNSDYIKMGEECQKWYLDGVKDVLDGKKNTIVREGDIVKLTINKNITKVEYILHENLDISLQEIKEDPNYKLEDIIDTKELYNIMVMWNEELKLDKAKQIIEL